ncbi:MAG: hypothetical protein ACOYEV_10365 [Candidatus Nanopelagicales bacterium]
MNTQPQHSDGSAASGPGDADRVRIRDAMDRILAGAPLNSDGKFTIKSLAAEAGVKRWLLTHKHTDLQDEFRAKAANQDDTPLAVQAAHADIQALQARIAQLSAALAIERETVKRLERVVNVLALAQAGDPRATSSGRALSPVPNP